MAGDVPSVFRERYVAPSLPVVPGSTHYSVATEPCSALSGCVSMPADPDALDFPACRNITTESLYTTVTPIFFFTKS